MGISFRTSGSFDNFERYLRKSQNMDVRGILEQAGSEGVSALAAATPRETGIAANSWHYEIKKIRSGWVLAFLNSDVENGFPVVVMLQIGHGTGTGGYVQGRDFINPAIRPIFDRLSDQLGKVVIYR